MGHRGGEFLERLSEQVLIGDGAMGTELYRHGVPLGASYDQLNLANPDLVRRVHEAYLAAGAQLIETNTFGANRLKLGELGLGEQVAAINARGAELARASAGPNAFVAGSVGPLPSHRPGDAHEPPPTDPQVREIYTEQILALANGGVDLLILETFSNRRHLAAALSAALALTDLPVIAQMVFLDHRRAGDAGVIEALTSLAADGAHVVGTNCGRGVSNVLRVIETVGSRTEARISAFPNAGYPQDVGGRIMYLASPQYLAEMADRMAAAGANLIGGCCGTKPEDIRAIAERLAGRRPAQRVRVAIEVAPAVEPPDLFPPAEQPPCFLDRAKDRPLLLAELDPPYGLDVAGRLSAARELIDLGVDVITVGDNPLAAMRLGGVEMAHLYARELGAETMFHLSCRDRNLIGLQSALLGAAALGLRNVLAVTGDPAKIGNVPGATSVYDVNSLGLLEIVARLNAGQNHAGGSIGLKAGLRPGVAFNPNFKRVEFEVAKLGRKADAGALYALTQVVFDAALWHKARRLLDERGLKIPVFVGVFPLISQANAEFLHNEVPGMAVPQAVRDRMAGRDKRSARAEGVAIAAELIEQILPTCAGIYLVPPFNRVENIAGVCEAFHRLVGRARPGRSART